ncbi:MAG: hypothetical protein ACKVOH_06490 [Chlamydiales bacterium]
MTQSPGAAQSLDTFGYRSFWITLHNGETSFRFNRVVTDVLNLASYFETTRTAAGVARMGSALVGACFAPKSHRGHLITQFVRGALETCTGVWPMRCLAVGLDVAATLYRLK